MSAGMVGGRDGGVSRDRGVEAVMDEWRQEWRSGGTNGGNVGRDG